MGHGLVTEGKCIQLGQSKGDTGLNMNPLYGIQFVHAPKQGADPPGFIPTTKSSASTVRRWFSHRGLLKLKPRVCFGSSMQHTVELTKPITQFPMPLWFSNQSRRSDQSAGILHWHLPFCQGESVFFKPPLGRRPA